MVWVTEITDQDKVHLLCWHEHPRGVHPLLSRLVAKARAVLVDMLVLIIGLKGVREENQKLSQDMFVENSADRTAL